MLKLQPDICIAFAGGTGTQDMVEKCRNAGVKTFHYDT